MTTTRDSDRIIRAWLDLMPDEVPERTVDAVLEAIESVPQRRWVLGGHWRNPAMSRLLLAGAAAATIALVGGIFLFRPQPSVGPPAPSTTTPRSVSPSVGTATAPAALVQRWIGPDRNVPGLGSSAHTTWDVEPTSAVLSGSSYGSEAMRATVAVAGAEIRLSATTTGGCAASDVGRYRWTLSPQGSRLSVSDAGDPCAARQAAFAGDWYRVACRAANNCFGAVEAGTYPSVNFGPTLDPDQAPESVFGAVTYTLPDGWAVAGDHTTDLRLVPADAYVREGPNGPPDDRMNGIEAWVRPAAVKQSATCDAGLDASVERTAAGLIDWVAGLTSLDTSTPTSLTIDGHPGRSIDVRIAASWTDTCGLPDPTVMLFGEGVGAAGPIGDDPWAVGLTGASRLRIVALDLEDDRTVLFIVRADDPTAFDATVQAAMPIVESFRFQ